MILLLSGGIDSVCAYRLLGAPPSIHFTLGTRSCEREHDVINWIDVQSWSRRNIIRSLDLERLGRWERANGYLPYRNGLMVTFAAMHDPDVVVAQVAEWAPDKSRRYWRKLQAQLNLASKGAIQGIDRKVGIRAPFANLTKGQLLGRYRSTYGPRNTEKLLHETWSCYGEGGVHCGRCSGCVQRKVAERVAGTNVTVYIDEEYLPDFTQAGLWRDAVRWVRDNQSVTGLVRRVVEVQQYR